MDLSADFTTTSLGRAISRKPTTLERLQWLFVPLVLFLLSQLHLPAQSLNDNTEASLFYSVFFSMVLC